MKQNYLSTITLFIIFSMTGMGCTPAIVNKPAPNEISTPISLPTAVFTISSQISSSSIQELSHYADVVVIGRVVAKEKVINTARDVIDLTKPDNRLYSINQVYKVEVEKVLKGDERNNLLLVQNQGLLGPVTANTPALSEIEAEIRKNEQKTFIPLSINNRYLFFLRVLDSAKYEIDGYRSSELYAGVMEPWRFVINDQGMIAPETLLEGIDQYFPPQDLEFFLDAIGQTDVPGQSSYPYPEPGGGEIQIQTPYP